MNIQLTQKQHEAIINRGYTIIIRKGVAYKVTIIDGRVYDIKKK